MEVVIAGAGAIGLLIGSYLAESGQAVSFYTRREAQAVELQERGVKRIVNGETNTFQVEAFSELTLAPQKALWILAVKSMDLPALLKRIEESAHPAYLLFVQNGLRHFELGSATSVSSVGFASLTHGAGKENDHTVVHKGIGTMNIAQLRGERGLIPQMIKAESPSFPINVQQDAFQMLLRKAIINCCINPLTALLNVSNGGLLENETAHKLMKVVYNELAAVYPEVARSVPFSEVETVCRTTARNQSSMFTDRLNRVPMEIDTIVSATLGVYREKMPTLALFEMLLKAIDEGKESA